MFFQFSYQIFSLTYSFSFFYKALEKHAVCLCLLMILLYYLSVHLLLVYLFIHISSFARYSLPIFSVQSQRPIRFYHFTIISFFFSHSFFFWFLFFPSDQVCISWHLMHPYEKSRHASLFPFHISICSKYPSTRAALVLPCLYLFRIRVCASSLPLYCQSH